MMNLNAVRFKLVHVYSFTDSLKNSPWVSPLGLLIRGRVLPLNGLKKHSNKMLAEAAKLFIGVWCDTDIILFGRIELGSF